MWLSASYDVLALGAPTHRKPVKDNYVINLDIETTSMSNVEFAKLNDTLFVEE